MKHKLAITFVLLGMFLVTQFIGLYVVDYYSDEDHKLPFGMEPPAVQSNSEYYSIFPSIVIAFIFAILLFFLFTKFRIEIVLKLWFFMVVTVAIALTLNTILPEYEYAHLIAFAIGLPLAFLKIFKRELIVHNLTELMIYPGIAAVFVPLLNVGTAIALLILISIYDMWAVWKSGIMQKMAKFQMNKLKVFGGFLVPYLDKKERQKIKQAKAKKSKKGKAVPMNVAILGGGDVIFPIIIAGVMLKTFGFFHALAVILGSLLGLGYLLFFAKKKKFYPAMPFISLGIFLGMGISYLLF